MVKGIRGGGRRMPFLRLLGALVSGILLEYYGQAGILTWLCLLVISLLILLSFFFLSFFNRFRLNFISGISGFSAFMALGGILLHERDIENSENWIGHNKDQTRVFRVIVEEPPFERPGSYRLLASVHSTYEEGRLKSAQGRVFLYLKKDSSVVKENIPAYGDVIRFKGTLSPIRGFGNPGSFDFGRYCRMKRISHQVFVSKTDIQIEREKKGTFLKTAIHSMREWMLDILKVHFRDMKELGLAEALLIGYKNDLDRSLVKDYADTGVVHIIAISGLHIGLIYWLLGVIFQPLKKAGLKGTVAVLTISGLWLFSLLAGAQPSILRAALMFTCLVLQKLVEGQNSTYNTIAFSAFVLLCIDPYWLWDAGFQLSYAAVVSIIAFMKHVYSWFFFRNKILDAIWKTMAVTIAAQVLTFPLCVYYFQQFPVYFLLTNLIAVPLSTAILFGEIILVVFTFIPGLANLISKILSWMIQLMNLSVEAAAQLPMATWEPLIITVSQTLILVGFTLSAGFALIERSVLLTRVSAYFILVFSLQRLASFIAASKQELLIVYNVPGKSAIDLVKGRKYVFFGDSSLKREGALSEQYLQPTRNFYRTSASINQPEKKSILPGGRKILLLHDAPVLRNISRRPEIDLLILSGNPKLYFTRLVKQFNIDMVVIDGSVPGWKSRYWKKDCDSLGIAYHDVSERGAFVMKTR